MHRELLQTRRVSDLLGVGVTASTIIPSALVITNWFNENRGLALGIAFAGMPLGGTTITICANYVVQHYGFRAGYLAMAVPIAVIDTAHDRICPHTIRRASIERGLAESRRAGGARPRAARGISLVVVL
jgi:MFS family permease